jgi:cytochrome c-type biogenesis protein CcsB
MPVHVTLASYSDWSYAAALVIYVGALLLHAAQLAGRTAPRSELVAVGRGIGGPAESKSNGRGELPAEVEPVARDRSERLGRMAVSLTVLGAMIHAASLVTRGLAVDRVPWGNMYEFGSSICLVGLVAWLFVLRREPALLRLGAFVLLPIVVLLFTSGTLLYSKAAALQPALQSYWIVIHVSAAVIASGVLLVAGVASLLYLARAANDRDGDRFARLGQRLPAADVLDRLAYRGTVFAFPVWTFAIITGAVWAETAWGRYWGWDPKETVAFVAWVVYAGYLHARATAGWRSGRAAWVNVAGLVVMVFNLFFVNLVVAGLHSYAGVG